MLQRKTDFIYVHQNLKTKKEKRANKQTTVIQVA